VSVVRHHSAPAAPADRGRELGRVQADRIAGVAAVYARLFERNAGLGPEAVTRLGGGALDRIAETTPDLAAEIEGIAAGAGLPVETVAALNARTEVLGAAAGECSTVACTGEATASGRPFGIQTWDWHDELRDGWLVWTIEHPDGRRTETLTEAGIVGKIGVSNRGVAVLLNILDHADDGEPVGDPVHVLCRRVLDEAESAGRALEILAAARPSASSAVTVVADGEGGGTACTIELSPAGPGYVLPDERGILVHTNHFLADPGRPGDAMPRRGPDSILRLDDARRSMRHLPDGSIDPEVVLAAMRSHRGAPASICCHAPADAAFGDRWTTLATIVAEPGLGEMRVLRGGPCQSVDASTTAAAARQ
jgi:isopenicillin-N N-acyltransferase-like protein